MLRPVAQSPLISSVKECYWIASPLVEMTNQVP